LKTRYVVDTNVLVHWLLKPDGLAARIINSSLLELFTPSAAIDELFEHSDEWARKKPRANLAQFVSIISTFMDVVNPPYDSPSERYSRELLSSVDPKDIPFLTVALTEDADIWSYNKHFDSLPVARVRSEDIRDRARNEIPELWSLLQ